MKKGRLESVQVVYIFLAECLYVPVSFFYDNIKTSTKAFKVEDQLYPNLKYIADESVVIAIRELIDSIVMEKKGLP